MTLTDAQIRELLGLTFTPADASLIVASRARLRALCEEVLRLRAANIQPCACCHNPATHRGGDGNYRCELHRLNGD